MKLIIKTKDVTMTPALSEYIEIRVERIAKRVAKIGKTFTVRAEIEIARTTTKQKKGDVFYAECNLSVPRKLIRAEATAGDARVALDQVVDEIEAQLKKDKEKKIAKSRTRPDKE